MFELPVVDERIGKIAPGFRAMSVIVDAMSASQGELDPDILLSACAVVLEGGPGWAEAHLASWRKPISGSAGNRTGPPAPRRR